MTGDLSLDGFVSHTFDGLSNVNKAIDTLHEGNCIRAVVQVNKQ